MSRKLIAGNWKMHKSVAEAVATIDAFVDMIERRQDVDVVICPQYLCLPKLHEVLHRTHIDLGAQDVFWIDSGAFTGQLSPAMLKEFAVTHCIVGHSESRGRFGKLEVPKSTLSYFGETDETVNLKTKALLYHSIAPIVCVGENIDERNEGRTDSVIRVQLGGGLADIEGEEMTNFAIAYEPVWAIGTGQTCDPEEANRVCKLIRDWLVENRPGAEAVRILYGGSVKSSNSKELLHQPNIDGALVGGASLDAKEFCEIVMSA